MDTGPYIGNQQEFLDCRPVVFQWQGVSRQPDKLAVELFIDGTILTPELCFDLLKPRQERFHFDALVLEIGGQFDDAFVFRANGRQKATFDLLTNRPDSIKLSGKNRFEMCERIFKRLFCRRHQVLPRDLPGRLRRARRGPHHGQADDHNAECREKRFHHQILNIRRCSWIYKVTR